MGLIAFVDCRTFWGERKAELERWKKNRKPIGDLGSASPPPTPLSNDATAAREEGAKMGAEERKERAGPAEQPAQTKRRTDDSSRAGFPSEWSGVHWFNYLAVRLIVAVARKGKECEM